MAQGRRQKGDPYNYSISNKLVVNGAALSRARIDANFSMDDVAKALGCNKSSVSRWEQERLVPSEERINKLAEMYGTWAFVQGNPNYGKDTRRKARKTPSQKLSA